jgi:poly(3-hydroxybutyrate) depolymerase
MMANRMWCESPGTFDGFGALAGPPSTQLASTGAHPCAPATVKPYIGVVGDSDTGLQTSGNMSASTWTLSSYNGASPAWVTSTVMNDKEYHGTRISMACGGSAGAPSTSGQVTTYSDCSDTLKFMVIAQTTINGSPSGGDHCLALTAGSSCVTTLAGDTGLDYKSIVMDFLLD